MPLCVLATLQGLPPQLWTMLIAMLPVAELRGAIPYAIKVGGLRWQEAYIYAVIGNWIPVLPILLLLDRVSNWLMRYRLGRKFFNWIFERTRKRGKLIQRFEAIGLTLFVAIPLPVTGAWTGCIAASLFKIPRKWAVPAIFLGVMIAGVIVTLASLGVISFWGAVKNIDW